MLRFEGQTGPYLQYTSVRINSILKQAPEYDFSKVDYNVYKNDDYFELIKLIASFKEAIRRSASDYNPSIIAKHLLQLAQVFNSFYGKTRILVADEVIQNSNLLLIESIRTVINEGLRLLGIKYLDEM